jgi:hypothetical protein
LSENGRQGRPRAIGFKHGGVQIDNGNAEIFINGRWFHISEIRACEKSAEGYNILFVDTKIEKFRWKSMFNAKQEAMGAALKVLLGQR